MTNQAAVIRSTVTGQFLVDFVHDSITGHGKNSVPVWGDKLAALPATPENIKKVAAVGMWQSCELA